MGRRDEVDPTRTYKTGLGREEGEYEETHPAFGVAVVSRASGGSRTLFQSDLQHSETIRLSVRRAVRGRHLMRDWVHPTTELVEIEMSLSQWGSLVSSIGIGSGVPVTIRHIQGDDEYYVPGIPYEPRIAAVLGEARDSTSRLLEQVRRHYSNVKAAFDEKKGVKALRDAITSMGHALNNAESNTEFAVKSVVNATERVTSQAKADIEAHILNAALATGLTAPVQIPELLGSDTTLTLEEAPND